MSAGASGAILWCLWLRANTQHSTRIHTLTDVHPFTSKCILYSTSSFVHIFPSSHFLLRTDQEDKVHALCPTTGSYMCEQGLELSWSKACALLNKGLCPLEQRLVPSWTKACEPSWTKACEPSWTNAFSLFNKGLGALLNEGMWALLNKGRSPLECAGSLLK